MESAYHVMEVTKEFCREILVTVYLLDQFWKCRIKRPASCLLPSRSLSSDTAVTLSGAVGPPDYSLLGDIYILLWGVEQCL